MAKRRLVSRIGVVIPPNSKHPKYRDEYYRILIEKTGDKYKAY